MARSSAVRPGAGDSSTSFWWRRWIEQSRSPERDDRARARRRAAGPRRGAPGGSRARGRRVHRRTPRSLRAIRRPARPADRPTRSDAAHPAPPPPAAALTSTGKPMRSRLRDDAVGCVRRVDGRGSSVPGTTGTPADARARRAASLSPSAVDRRARRADEDEAGVLDGARERRRAPRGSRSPGWIASRAGRARGLDDRVDAEVALARPARGPMRTASSAARTCSASRVGIASRRRPTRCPARGRRG